ncbi:alpha/beta fold hydrolase [Nonomuraea sp. B19D2]|uniref:alpha/beta fold hydrolase n=1 Tax=Nonomuraea sp. B19D2 TaxID=3159561 RepID=UPI0032DB9889
MISIDDVEIAYEEAGPAAPAGTVVLVHGSGADMRLWEHQFQALSEHHRVIRYDARGHGRSGDAEGEVCHHEDLLAVMDVLGVERAALAGSSMGGAYATEAALAAPSRVVALALIGSGLAGHQWPQEMLDQARARVRSSVPAASTFPTRGICRRSNGRRR